MSCKKCIFYLMDIECNCKLFDEYTTDEIRDMIEIREYLEMNEERK